jgi:4-hydroxybenzoate polyprenyltransferase
VFICVWLQTWLLFVLLSVVSMAMGFYDLWKNVPYFKQFVVHMFRPAAAIFEWLEGHTQVRVAGCVGMIDGMDDDE